jgi:asparagine synthase (glutamine-hydrolysing)
MASMLRHRGDYRPVIHDERRVALGYIGSAAGSAEGPARGLSVGGDRIHVCIDGFLTNATSLLGAGEANAATTGRSDAELLGELYARHGTSIFERLKGVYAAALWDGRHERLILVKDAIGHRPVFFADAGTGFLFASEAKALVGSGAVPFALDRESLTHFLSMRFLPAPHTMYKGISKLGAGQFLIRENGRVRIHQYWTPTFGDERDISLDEMVDELDDRIAQAVRTVLPSSGKTGSFLSGGLDSGLLVANLAESLQEPFDTFSLGVNKETDEVPLARLVSKKFQTVQHESYPDEQLVRILPKLIWHTDEPSDMVAVTGFLLTRFAAPHIDVALAGDGGDELFAGFPRYRGIRDAQYFRLMPAAIRNAIIAPIASTLGGKMGPGRFSGKVAWLTKVSESESLAEQYAAAVEFLRFDHAGKQQLFTEDAWKQVSHIRSERLISDVIAACRADNPLERLLYTDLVTRLPEHLLMINDRAGAAHGVEVMCPFTDQELVEFAGSIPMSMKIRGRQSKYIERRLAQRLLPEEVVNSRKTGWSFPFAKHCAGLLLPFLRSIFSDSLLVEHDVLRLEMIESLLDEHASRTADHHIRIWMLLNLEIWYRMAVSGAHHSDLMPWLDSHLGAEHAEIPQRQTA